MDTAITDAPPPATEPLDERLRQASDRATQAFLRAAHIRGDMTVDEVIERLERAIAILEGPFNVRH
jgi:hypothetical protein